MAPKLQTNPESGHPCIYNNAFERTIKTKVISSKYYFEYFSLTSMKLIAPYANTTAFAGGDIIYVADRV